MHNPLTDRRAGLLLHPTSLPATGHTGTLGPEAYRFVDFLHECGFGVWQTLPLGPTHGDRSPYQCLSVHAGDAALISLEDLAMRGWLQDEGCAGGGAVESRGQCLIKAKQTFDASAQEIDRDAFGEFKEQQSYWLDDYVLYEAIRQFHQNAPWFEWPVPLRDRRKKALNEFRQEHAGTIDQVSFEQFVFYTQWQALRVYANTRGIMLFGDIPIFVAHDSADVWAHRGIFTINKSGNLKVVAGVPPDYFSATGQRWGNPLYRWDRLIKDDFHWWLDRFRTQLVLFNIIRLDHFRGFEKYWEIPAESDTAIHGHWVSAPGEALFARLQDEFGDLPLVAEDLGVITPEVDALRKQFGFPGMKILQFAFDGGAGNPYLPHNHEAPYVVYTGTHDNDTTLGWYRALDKSTKQGVDDYLGKPGEPMPWPLIRAALASVANLAILPMQDILELDGAHRMNMPGSTRENWRWRFEWSQISKNLAARISHLIRMYGRGVN